MMTREEVQERLQNMFNASPEDSSVIMWMEFFDEYADAKNAIARAEIIGLMESRDFAIHEKGESVRAFALIRAEYDRNRLRMDMLRKAIKDVVAAEIDHSRHGDPYKKLQHCIVMAHKVMAGEAEPAPSDVVYGDGIVSPVDWKPFTTITVDMVQGMLNKAPVQIVSAQPALKPLDWGGIGQIKCPLLGKDYRITEERGMHHAWFKPFIEWKPLGAGDTRQEAETLCENHRNQKMRGQLK